MNETSKSLTFLGVAAVCCVIAIVTAPETRDPNSHESRMGQALFDPFDLSPTGIEIVEIDEEEGEAKSIEVVKTGKGRSSDGPAGLTIRPMPTTKSRTPRPSSLICVFSTPPMRPENMPSSVCLIRAKPNPGKMRAR